MTIVSWEIQQRHNYKVFDPYSQISFPINNPTFKSNSNWTYKKKKRGQGIHMAHVFSEQP